MMNTCITLIFMTLLCNTLGTKYVAFRLDDIQDYWLDEAQQAVIDVFKNANLPMTIGIIANSFGADSVMLDYVKSCLQQTSFPVEIANHGWNHEYFSTFTESEQATMLSESKTKTVGQLSPLISDITTFIPPFDDFNTDTITALQTAGYKVMTSDISYYGYDDNGNYCGASCGDRVYPGSNPNLLEYPAGSGTNDLFDQWTISVDESMTLIEEQVARDGFSVVMMHFNWYCSEAQDGSTVINDTMISMLQQLIQECQSAGYTLTTVGQLTQLLSSGSSSTSTSTTGQAPLTSGHALTTGHVSKSSSTTGQASPLTTGHASPLTTGHTATPLTTGASGSCTAGTMKCLTSETYSTCTSNGWGVSQSCQTGETCHASGSYIYCY